MLGILLSILVLPVSATAGQDSSEWLTCPGGLKFKKKSLEKIGGGSFDPCIMKKEAFRKFIQVNHDKDGNPIGVGPSPGGLGDDYPKADESPD